MIRHPGFISPLGWIHTQHTYLLCHRVVSFWSIFRIPASSISWTWSRTWGTSIQHHLPCCCWAWTRTRQAPLRSVAHQCLDANQHHVGTPTYAPDQKVRLAAKIFHSRWILASYHQTMMASSLRVHPTLCLRWNHWALVSPPANNKPLEDSPVLRPRFSHPYKSDISLPLLTLTTIPRTTIPSSNPTVVHSPCSQPQAPEPPVAHASCAQLQVQILCVVIKSLLFNLVQNLLLGPHSCSGQPPP